MRLWSGCRDLCIIADNSKVILRFHTLDDTEIDVTVRLSTSKRFHLLPEVPRSSFVPHLSLNFWASAREGAIGSCLSLPNC